MAKKSHDYGNQLLWNGTINKGKDLTLYATMSIGHNRTKSITQNQSKPIKLMVFDWQT